MLTPLFSFISLDADVSALVVLISHADQINNIFFSDEGALGGFYMKLIYTVSKIIAGHLVDIKNVLFLWNCRVSQKCSDHCPFNHITSEYTEA